MEEKVEDKKYLSDDSDEEDYEKLIAKVENKA